MSYKSILESTVKTAIVAGGIYIASALGGCMSPVLPQTRTEVTVEYNGPSIEESKTQHTGELGYVVKEGETNFFPVKYFEMDGVKKSLLFAVMKHNDACFAENPRHPHKRFWNKYRVQSQRALEGKEEIVLSIDENGLSIGVDGFGKRKRSSRPYLKNSKLDTVEESPNFCRVLGNTNPAPQTLAARVKGADYNFPEVAGTQSFSYDEFQKKLDSLHARNQGGQ